MNTLSDPLRAHLLAALDAACEDAFARWRAGQHRRLALLDDSLRRMVWWMDVALVEHSEDRAEAWRIIRRAQYDEQLRQLGLSRSWFVEASGNRRTRWLGYARQMESEDLEVTGCVHCGVEVYHWPSEPPELEHATDCASLGQPEWRLPDEAFEVEETFERWEVA